MSAVGELIHAGSLPYRATRSNPVSVTLPMGDGAREAALPVNGALAIYFLDPALASAFVRARPGGLRSSAQASCFA
jgi:hypothetical protein